MLLSRINFCSLQSWPAERYSGLAFSRTLLCSDQPGPHQPAIGRPAPRGFWLQHGNIILFTRQPYAALLRLRACRALGQEEPAGVPFPADGLHGMKHPSACQANPVRREGGRRGCWKKCLDPDLFFIIGPYPSLQNKERCCPWLLVLSSRLNTRIQPAREVPILARQPRGHDIRGPVDDSPTEILLKIAAHRIQSLFAPRCAFAHGYSKVMSSDRMPVGCSL